MRQLNFRVWDTKVKTFISGHDLYSVSHYYNIFSGTFDTWDSYYRGCGDNFIVSLSTNIFDKNRREIFEGDVINYTEKLCDLGDAQILTGVVKYDEKCGCYGISANMETNCWNYFYEGVVNNFEIVGNIFERPNF